MANKNVVTIACESCYTLTTLVVKASTSETWPQPIYCPECGYFSGIAVHNEPYIESIKLQNGKTKTKEKILNAEYHMLFFGY